MSYLRSALMALAVVFVSAGPVASFNPAFAEEKDASAEKTEEHAGDGDNHDHGSGGEDHGASAHGDEVHDEAHGTADMPPILSFDPGAAVINLAIFLGTFLILAKLVWPVILGGLKAREDKIASDLESAQAANQKAEAVLAEYETKVADVAAEAQTILADARRDAESNATKILDEAKADAKRQGERALADIETAKKVALSEIAGQTSTLAMGVAKQVVGRELNAEDHAELIKKALEQVPSNN